MGISVELRICQKMKVKDAIKMIEEDGWHLARTKGQSPTV
jgi:predicted RNA binding protein YcfA (HicA-like mRNA interferase family)